MAITQKGREPANIKKRMDTLFHKLDEAYPDKAVVSLQKDHKKWAETVTELYRALGYSDSTAFLEAYGYTVQKQKAGRPGNNHMEIIQELQRRYPGGIRSLARENPDLAVNRIHTHLRKNLEEPVERFYIRNGILPGLPTDLIPYTFCKVELDVGRVVGLSA